MQRSWRFLPVRFRVYSTGALVPRIILRRLFTFPTVNINWLLFGEGEMFGSSDGLAPAGASDPSLQSSDGNVSAPDLFSANTEQYSPLVQPAAMPRREDNGYGKIHPDVIQKINYVDKPVRRKIKEIRVFYSDGTFESFAPQED